MQLFFTFVPIVLITLMGLYLYFITQRFLRLIFPHIKRRYILILVILLCLLEIPLGGYWILIVMHLLGINLIMEILYFVLKRIGKASFQRRIAFLYRSFLIPVIVTCLVLGYGYWNMTNVHKTTYSISSSKKIRKEGYKITLISDLHFGNSLHVDDIDQYTKKISKENADIVALAGDIVDESTTYEEMKKAFESLGKIKNKHGIYYIYGNHDVLRWGTENFSPEQLKETIEENGITILADDTMNINDDLTIIGRKDLSDSSRSSTKDVLNGVNHEKFLLSLDHQPMEDEEADSASNGIDLQLSGHTHDGQYFPVGFISGLMKLPEFNYGYKQIDDYQLIITSGIAGWGLPIRTEGISEYVVINLTN